MRLLIKTVISGITILGIQQATHSFNVTFAGAFIFAFLFLTIGRGIKWLGYAGILGGSFFISLIFIWLFPLWYALGSVWIFQFLASGTLGSINFINALIITMVLYVFNSIADAFMGY